MKNFDNFAAVDWSGALSPVMTRSIALAECTGGNDGPPRLDPAIRSRRQVADWIVARAKEGIRTLVGVDCNFGYSAETGALQFGADYSYLDVWRAVEDANTGNGNYFAGGYWTHHDYGRHFWTVGTRPEGFTMPRRLVERLCGESGHGWPESPFKLIGPKQVGKGGLAGMRMAYDLKRRLGDRLAVWPYEMESADRAVVVLTEIYPRLFLRQSGHGNGKVRDEAALNRILGVLESRPLHGTAAVSDHDADALVSAAGLRFLCGTGTTVPENISCPPAPPDILRREGWIFGAGA